jgi:glyoxylase-like metal-dependent hydrolase (beta-lactamase superfamily II)
MRHFQIYPLRLGTLIRPWVGHLGETNELPIIAWYVTDGEREFMVDTGGEPANGLNFVPYEQTSEDFLDLRLNSLGVDPARITTVILTHLHWDHIYYNFLFPYANFYVQRKELEYARHPLEHHAYLYDIDSIMRTEYKLVEGDTELFEGVQLLFTPGHSAGGQTVIVNTKVGRFAIAGDTIIRSEHWEATPKILNGIQMDNPEVYQKSLNRIGEMSDFVLPGH